MAAQVLHYLEGMAHTGRGLLDEGTLHIFTPLGFTPDIHSHAYNTIRDTTLAMLFMGMVDVAGVRLSGTSESLYIYQLPMTLTDSYQSCGRGAVLYSACTDQRTCCVLRGGGFLRACDRSAGCRPRDTPQSASSRLRNPPVPCGMPRRTIHGFGSY